MAVLSNKIIQLMAYETQLKTLKEEIVLQHLTSSKSPIQEASGDVLREKIQQYELVSAKYNELFQNILLDTHKMAEEYHELKNLN
jgi:hypothetical protein